MRTPHILILKMDAEISEIFVDFSREKTPEKFLPLTSIGQKLVISPFQSEISDVPAGCAWLLPNSAFSPAALI